MKELLRIVHGRQDETEGDILSDYNVEVYEGDILYIQGIEDSGIRALARLLAGDCALLGGSLFLNGKRVEDYDRNTAYRYQIYTITAESDFVETMNVAENLEAVRHLPFSLVPYSSKRALKKVNGYLVNEQAGIRGEDEPWMLSQTERKKLSILKANLHGAKLIVLSALRGFYEGKEAAELCDLIRRLNAEGITFIILSRCYTVFAEIASRIQVMAYGMDLKEWAKIDDQIRLCLKRPAGEHGMIERAEPDRGASEFTSSNNQTAADPDSDKAAENADAAGARFSDRPAGMFLGMYDYEWEMEDGVWHYLSFVQRQNPVFWEREVRAQVPAEGESKCGGTVVIPRDSGERLVENLDIADNLLLPIPFRVGRSFLGIIRRDVRQNIADRFCRMAGVESGQTRVLELSRIQKKLLSIYRWELSHPDILILESPYSGMLPEEVRILREYLKKIANRGIRILYCSKTPEEMREDCDRVIYTRNGKNAKITTVSQLFPPQKEWNF